MCFLNLNQNNAHDWFQNKNNYISVKCLTTREINIDVYIGVAPSKFKQNSYKLNWHVDVSVQFKIETIGFPSILESLFSLHHCHRSMEGLDDRAHV